MVKIFQAGPIGLNTPKSRADRHFISRKMLSKNNDSQLKQKRSNSDTVRSTGTIPAEIFECLRSSSLMDEPTLRQLAPMMRLRRLSGGDLIIKEGSKGQAIFLVLQGSVTLYSEVSETEIGELGPGNVFGEIGALMDVPRTMTIRAKPPGCTIGVLLKETILSIASLTNTLLKLARDRLLADEDRDREVLTSCPEKYRTFLAKLQEKFPNIIVNKETGRFIKRSCGSAMLLTKGPSVVRVLEGSVTVRSALDPDQNLSTFGEGEMFEIPASPEEYRLLQAASNSSCIYYEHSDEEANTNPMLLEESCDYFDAAINQASRLSQILSSSGVHRRRSIAIWSDECFLRPTKSIQDSSKRRVISESATGMTMASFPDSAAADDVVELLERLGIPAEHHRSAVVRRDGGTGLLWLNLDPIHQYFDNDTLEAILLLFGKKIAGLDLTDCWPLSDQALAKVARLCPKLTQLILSNCWSVTEKGFTRLLQLAPKTLDHLEIKACPGLTCGALDLIGSLRLKHADFSLCKNLSGQVWTCLLGQRNTLETLIMRRCTSISGQSILEALQKEPESTFPCLQALDLSDCSFLPDAAICSIVARCPRLAALSISFCQDLDIHFFQNLLKANPSASLTTLIMEHCHKFVTNEAISVVAEHWVRLEVISVRGCTLLTDRAVVELERLPRLKSVDLSACPGVSIEALTKAAVAHSWNLQNPPTD